MVDVRLGHKYTSVLPHDLKPIYEDFLLWKQVMKIATVLYYHYRFIILIDKIKKQSKTN